MKTSIALVCGRCNHEDIVDSACFVLFAAVCIRAQMAFWLGFTNSKSKNTQRDVIFTTAIASIDSICSFLPFALSFSDFAYIHCVDAFFSCIAWYLFTTVIRSQRISVWAAACSSISLVAVDCVLIYGIIQSSFSFHKDSSLYDKVTFICVSIRVICTFVNTILVSYAMLSDHGLLPWMITSDIYQRIYKSESSHAVRVSLMQYQEDGPWDMSSQHQLQEHPHDGSDSDHLVTSTTAGDASSGAMKDTEAFQSHYAVLFVSTVTALFELARTRPITLTDIPPLPPERSSTTHAHIVRQLLQPSDQLPSPSLLGVLHILYLDEYLAAGGMLLVKSLSVFVGPIMLDKLVQAADNDSSWNVIACYIAVLFVSKVVSAFSSTHYSLACQNLSVSIAGGIKGALYQKILRLSLTSRQQHTMGKITNLYTVDADRVVNVTIALHNFWALPLQVGNVRGGEGGGGRTIRSRL